MARSVRQGRPVRRRYGPPGPAGAAGPAGVAGTTGATGAAGPAGRDATSLIVGLASTRLRSVAGRRMVVRYVATAAGSATLELRRGSRVVERVRAAGRVGRNQIVRRVRARAGSYALRLVYVAADGRTTSDSGTLTLTRR